MSEPIEESYFNWLCAKVKKSPFPLYLDLFKILYRTEFIGLMPGDENRAEDGKELREDFIRETQCGSIFDWDPLGCSVLEMLVAFSNRAWFLTEKPSTDWFWIFVENLRLSEYRHPISNKDAQMIEQEILYDFIWRMYKANGDGGLFPMRWPQTDQRSVEIWYQFCEYVDEEGLD